MEPAETSVDFVVHWVTLRTDFNRVESACVTNEGDDELFFAYGQICLIVKVGPKGKREECS